MLGPKPKHLETGQSSFEHTNMPERKTKGDSISPNYIDAGRKGG